MPYPKPLSKKEKAGGGEDGIDLAVVLGGEPGEEKSKRPKPMAAEPSEEELPPGFQGAAEEYLDESLPMDQRARALKTAIHLCYDQAEG